MAKRINSLAIAVIALSSMLAGCFEITTDAVVSDNGEAKISVEFAVSAELMALVENPAFTNKGTSDGSSDFLRNCGNPQPRGEALPAGVRSVEQKRGNRAGMMTCTIVADLSDPIQAFEHAKKLDVTAPDNAPAPDFTIVRLDGGVGYRIKGVLTPPKAKDIPPDAEKMATAIMVAMLANRFVTVTISSNRIENTNGELAADGRKVTWKIPLISLFAPSAAMPHRFEADVIFAEGLFARWKRKLLQ